MNFITKQEYDELFAKEKRLSKGRYWEGRWGYTNEVVKILEQENIESAIEIGTKELKIVQESDVMDLNNTNCTYNWDAKETPWPIKDKQYDVLVALQVWEHLKGHQREAFKEVMRTCKMTILSFPYKWDVANDPIHRWIDEEKIKEWTLGVEPVKVIPIISKHNIIKSRRSRIIYFFKF